jgi:polygalacturonase
MRLNALTALALAAATTAVAVTVNPPPKPVIPARVFDVTQPPFNAVADGVTDNAAALQAAVDAASAAGGGIVLLPPAPLPYASAPFALVSRIHLKVASGAVLQALPFGRYPLAGDRYADWITAKNAEDIEMSGGGVLDGQGHAWWQAFEKDEKMPHRPYLVKLSSVNRLHVHDITLKDSPMFHLVPDRCENVTIESVTITSPDEGAHNTDGIDPSGSSILIRNCRISVGDDNIAVKAGAAFCRDITILDCAFGTGHGLSIGGQSTKGLDGMTVARCSFSGTTSGLRMKADPTQGGLVQNVTYTDITMADVQYPIVFYSYYKNVGNPGHKNYGPEKAAAWNAAPPLALASDKLPVWRNITIDGLTVKGATGRSVIWGLPLADAMISNITLRNVSYAGDFGIRIFNAHNVRFSGTTCFAVAKEAPVTAYNALVIVAQPQDCATAAGSTATFTVAVAGASGAKGTAPRFQWMRDGAPLSDGAQPGGWRLSGAATSTLTIENVQPAAAGRYWVRISNALDVYDTKAGALAPDSAQMTIESEAAVLTVAP